MKTIFTLLLSTLFSVSLFAYEGTRLTISSIGSNKMHAEVDGRRYNLDGNTVSIRDVRSGYHNVRVYHEVKRNNGRWWDFAIGNNRRQEIIYNSSINLREGFHFDIVINRFGKVLVDEHRINRDDEWYNEEDYYDRDKDRYHERNWENDRGGGNNRDRNYDNNYNRAMNDDDFNLAKESIRQVWFENSRIATAKQIMDRNYFTSRQVKDMLLLFTFENNRLDLAKYAYGRTVDKGNYFVVNDVFTFNSNRDELAKFIREYR